MGHSTLFKLGVAHSRSMYMTFRWTGFHPWVWVTWHLNLHRSR